MMNSARIGATETRYILSTYSSLGFLGVVFVTISFSIKEF